MFNIICITIIVGILLPIWFILINKKHALNYNEDIIYLNAVINREITFYLSVELNSMNLDIIGIDTYNNMITEITKRIIKSLSSKYIEVLSFYFSNDGLHSHIFKAVFNQVLPYCVNNNSMKRYYDKQKILR